MATRFITQYINKKFCKKSKKGGLGFHLFPRLGSSTQHTFSLYVSAISGFIRRFKKAGLDVPVSAALGNQRVLNIFIALLSLCVFKITKFSIHIQIRYKQYM